jgi:hypothetical protein
MIEPRNISDRQILDEALAEGAGLKLPLIARGRSAREMARFNAWADRVLALLGVLLLWLFLLPLYDQATGPAGRLTYFILCGAGSLFGLAGWIWHVRRRRRHCTRGVEVEVAPELITLRRDGQSHHLRYADVEFGLTRWTGKSGAHFEGIVLESPLGPLRLEQGYFDQGRAAAAAILFICNRGDVPAAA